MLPGLEAEEEVAGVFGIDAEGVHATARVGFRVGGEPAFCEGESVVSDALEKVDFLDEKGG